MGNDTLKRQRTLKASTSLSGIGLHTGNSCSLTFHPAPENHGIRFRRLDVPGSPSIPALIDHVVDISRGTTIGMGEVRVHTVEHVLAALAGLEIDNALIDLTASEPPVGDGSALPFIEALTSVGFEEQNAPKEYLEIEQTLIYHDDAKGIDLVVVPAPVFRITYMVDYRNPALGTQYTSMYDLAEEFVREYAAARTFCFLSEVEMLKEQGLIKGGSTDNALVILDRPVDPSEFDRLKALFGLQTEVSLGENGILDGKPLRYYNEPVRHKALDLIGDLALLGLPLRGHVLAARAGHAAHIELVRLIRKEYEKKKIIRSYQGKLSKDIIFDAAAISRLLPHRYPFLLVDRIVELSPGEQVAGLKCVTINEPFFQGHFPGYPIMPGVLVIEALGQAGGVLLLNSVDDPEKKLVFFTGLDEVRFRKPVLPGDQLFLKVEMEFFRRGLCRMKGKAYVNDTVVAEAVMSAVVRNREEA
ncbi:MAG: bifunctional UDP-3-O-[3-hydroxymyristoyl] N-acetylglucosamine deacetylase/3-hydroxyacyl-ACP dehydratase [Candidatus Zixiibacteriota bacterium]|nr:MAG: bifunctional UDP-3-O-[3-hydroxymyristoyl] N-acetylglucosamine deacetylase/3-hydroxyacyl-ACP dehydratase [candidate division Zixibacteria bacterium]